MDFNFQTWARFYDSRPAAGEERRCDCGALDLQSQQETAYPPFEFLHRSIPLRFLPLASSFCHNVQYDNDIPHNRRLNRRMSARADSQGPSASNAVLPTDCQLSQRSSPFGGSRKSKKRDLVSDVGNRMFDDLENFKHKSKLVL